MSSADFRLAFEKYSHTDWQDCLKRTTIKIIDHHPPTERKWHTSEFWTACKAEGIKISYCSNPATPIPITGVRNSLTQVEWNFAFENDFHEKLEKEPVAGAISISHLRALNEAMKENKETGLIILLEQDVETHTNSMFLFANFVANWWGKSKCKNASMSV